MKHLNIMWQTRRIDFHRVKNNENQSQKIVISDHREFSFREQLAQILNFKEDNLCLFVPVHGQF